MKENVTDFPCVFEFMDITGSCSVFGHLVGPFIFISSKTYMWQIVKRFEDKLQCKQVPISVEYQLIYLDVAILKWE